VKSDPTHPAGIPEILKELNEYEPAPEALAKLARGVKVRALEPEHAEVTFIPCPNSTGAPELRVMLAASVVCKKYPPPRRRVTAIKRD
jgi:hypothetical protein